MVAGDIATECKVALGSSATINNYPKMGISPGST